MKSTLLTLSSLLITVQSASILPIDSSSSVQVKSNGQEYAYTIHENKAIPLEPLPVVPFLENHFLKVQPQEKILPNDLKRLKEPELHGQEKLILEKGEQLKTEGMDPNQMLLQGQGFTQGQGLTQGHGLNQGHGLPQGQGKLELIGGQKLEKPLEQLYIPGYRLIPSSELQLLEYPYYYQYLSNYAYHYPYIRFL